MSLQPHLPLNPFVGLRPFESDEALLFFGRGDQTTELLEQLHQHRFLAVVGSSGCGKSSLIRAGLIPKLKAGMLVEERDRWFIATMKPGNHPRKNLATALSQVLPEEQPDKESLAQTIRENGITAVLKTYAPVLEAMDGNLLLLVDQFEEIFRFGIKTTDPARQEAAIDFVSIMLALAAQTELPIYVVMTMRSDFLGDCDAFHGLPETMNRSQYLVPRLTRKQLRTVIEAPMRLYRRTITPRLVDRLLNDVGDASDELPVLQHALMRLWEKGEQLGDEMLDLEHYESIGTLQKALSIHAQEALTGLDEQRTQLLFQALTHTDESNRRIRRSISFEKIQAETGVDRQDLIPIVESFREPGRSFLMPPSNVNLTDDSLIDISHESLIRQWDTLRQWVDAEAEAADKYRQFVEAAKRYQAGKGSLLVDLDLQEALQWRQQTQHNAAWAERYGGSYDDTIRFIEESHEQQLAKEAREKQREDELEQAREREKQALEEQVALSQKANRQAQRFIGFLVAVVVLVAGLGVFAFFKAREAQRQTEVAQQKTYDANYHLAKVFEEKAGNALDDAKDNKEPDQNYQKSWFDTLTALAQEIGSESRLPVSVGKMLLPELRNGAFRQLWRSPTSPLDRVYSVAFSPDGKRLASGSSDRTIRLWDLDSGQTLATLTGHTASVWSVAFSPDGKRLASGSSDRTIRLWDLDSGQTLATLTGHTASVWSVAFSPDGKRLASGSSDRTIRLWDLTALSFLGIDRRTNPNFEKIYQGSLYLLPFRLETLRLVPKEPPLFLSPVGDYRFPKLRKFEKLDRPRPVGKDPVEWILENVD